MRAVALGLMSVIGGETAVRLANFVAILFIARTYGRAALGAYAACLAVVTVVVMFAENGLQTAAITKITPAVDERRQILGQITFSKTVLLIAASFILAAVAAWAKLNSLFLTIGICVALRTILASYSQLQLAVLKAVSQANWIGMIQSLHSLFLLAAVWLTFRQRWSLFALLALFAFGQFLEFLLSAAFLSRLGVSPQWPARLEFWETLRMATPFGITYGLANLIIRSDTIVLSAIVPLSELGAFSAANSVLLVVYASAWLFGSVLLPEMVRLADQPESLKLFTYRWIRLIVLVTVPGAVLAALLAPKAIVILYGPSFAGSGLLASGMLLACPLILLNSVYTTLAIATNSRFLYLRTYAAIAATTLVLDFLLGRSFGPTGVALAIFVREGAMLIVFRSLTSRLNFSTARLELSTSSGGNYRA